MSFLHQRSWSYGTRRSQCKSSTRKENANIHAPELGWGECASKYDIFVRTSWVISGTVHLSDLPRKCSRQCLKWQQFDYTQTKMLPSCSIPRADLCWKTFQCPMLHCVYNNDGAYFVLAYSQTHQALTHSMCLTAMSVMKLPHPFCL